MGGRPASTGNDIVGVALKTPKIHWAAACHTALKGRRSTPRGGEDRGSIEEGAEGKIGELMDILQYEAFSTCSSFRKWATPKLFGQTRSLASEWRFRGQPSRIGEKRTGDLYL